jgi:hypothetical protein
VNIDRKRKAVDKMFKKIKRIILVIFGICLFAGGGFLVYRVMSHNNMSLNKQADNTSIITEIKSKSEIVPSAVKSDNSYTYSGGVQKDTTKDSSENIKDKIKDKVFGGKQVKITSKSTTRLLVDMKNVDLSEQGEQIIMKVPKSAIKATVELGDDVNITTSAGAFTSLKDAAKALTPGWQNENDIANSIGEVQKDIKKSIKKQVLDNSSDLEKRIGDAVEKLTHGKPVKVEIES